jgi:hypothetical protein
LSFVAILLSILLCSTTGANNSMNQLPKMVWHLAALLLGWCEAGQWLVQLPWIWIWIWNLMQMMRCLLSWERQASRKVTSQPRRLGYPLGKNSLQVQPAGTAHTGARATSLLHSAACAACSLGSLGDHSPSPPPPLTGSGMVCAGTGAFVAVSLLMPVSEDDGMITRGGTLSPKVRSRRSVPSTRNWQPRDVAGLGNYVIEVFQVIV